MARGTLHAVDAEAALQRTDVVAVHTGEDTAAIGCLSVNPVIPVAKALPYPILVTGTVQAVGQPLAAVLASSAAAATDACDLIHVEVNSDDTQLATCNSMVRERSEVISGTEVTPGSDVKTNTEANTHTADAIDTEAAEKTVVARKRWNTDDCSDVFAKAMHVVGCEVTPPRLAASPMEPRSIAVEYSDSSESVTIWHSTQTPHRTRSELAAMLGIDTSRIRVIAQHVGGAFGMKGSLYPEEVFTVWAAFTHRRSTRWIASRAEDFLSATHGRGIHSKGSLALDENGQFLSLRATTQAPIGPWLPNSGLIPAWNAARILPSAYRVPSVDIETIAAQDGRGPTGIYRGAGRPEANLLMERLIDKAARATNIDPIELRLRNLLPPSELPFNTHCGDTLDSGDYARALHLLVKKTDYYHLKEMRTQKRQSGELHGLGIAFYLEPSGSGWESATVTIDEHKKVIVASGSSSQGHARETTYATIAARALAPVLPVQASEITVIMADTAISPEGIGALASRSTAIGGSAVLAACNIIVERLQKGETWPLTADVRYENRGQAWGYGAWLAQVSVYAETGQLSIEQVSCVDDAGQLIEPKLAHGQIVGGFAQGVGEATLERIVYDDNGQLLTGSLMDYALPRADDIPPIDVHTFETPSPTNLLGAKGLGEAGTIGAPAAILNAAVDALSPLGITDLHMPLTSESLWRAIQGK
jgi:carbon-monoxide dehydrogenase large subunit